MVQQQTAVVTGAGSGIGLSLCKELCEKGYKVIAIAHSQDEASHPKEHGCCVVQAELKSTDSFSAIKEQLKDEPLDVLVNNAAVFCETPTISVTKEEMLESYETNAIAPLLLVNCLIDNLKKAQHPKVINVSDRLGSIQDNKSGGNIAYRASKVALNMINKTLAVEIPEITFVAITPGFVKTGMTKGQGQMEAQESAKCLMQVIEKADQSYSGRLYQYDQTEIPF